MYVYGSRGRVIGGDCISTIEYGEKRIQSVVLVLSTSEPLGLVHQGR